MIHSLKTVNPYFDMIWHQLKTFELRKNDRGFKVGDTLVLQEYDTEQGYLKRQITASVAHIIQDLPGLDQGYVIMIIKPVRLTAPGCEIEL